MSNKSTRNATRQQHAETQRGKANIDWITDDLAAGGDFAFNPAVAQLQLADLLAQNVGMVIDCRQEADDFDVWMDHPEVAYYWLPTDDSIGWHIPQEHFDKAVEAARQAKSEGRKVLAHCHMGVNRGPSTAFAILLDRGMEPEAAFDLIRSKRPRAGISYAEDALVAHMRRQSGQVNWSRVDAFSEHVDKRMSPTVRASIAHTIRAHHSADALERAS